jgi:cobalt-zinc-cadmium efflux system protein
MPEAHKHHHGHNHHHHHGHLHGESLGRMRLAFWLNFIFAILELFGGLWTNSMAILSDAVHDFGDAMTIGIALFLEKKSHSQSDHSFSYGYRRLSTASAVLTGFVLVAGSIWILVESIPRLLRPEATNVDGMIGFAVLGVLVNGWGALRMSHGKSLNERVITWHLLEDLLGWVLVLVAAIVMKFFELPILDPLLGILLSAWVLWNVGKTLKEGMKIFLQATPGGVEISEVESYIKSLSNVQDCHHTHLWSIDGESHILTTHLVMKSSPEKTTEWKTHSELKSKIKRDLKEKFQISEATIEIEIIGDSCFDPAHA